MFLYSLKSGENGTMFLLRRQTWFGKLNCENEYFLFRI